MKRKTADNIVLMREQHPFKNSPQSLALVAEIKRLARELEICRRCRNAVLKRDVAERREVWEQLPSIFGLSEAECRWNAPVAGDDSSSDSGNDWA